MQMVKSCNRRGWGPDQGYDLGDVLPMVKGGMMKTQDERDTALEELIIIRIAARYIAEVYGVTEGAKKLNELQCNKRERDYKTKLQRR